MGGSAGRLGPAAGRILASIEDTLRHHAMLAGGETVLVAVSGGSDSLALLHLLHALSPRWRLSLHALYVDHGLRPDSARDGGVVCRLAAELGVPAAAVEVAVERGESPEAAARRARYRALERHADRLGAARIAVAHTADDQAETVLMRILAGTGIRGLAGIPPVRGRIIRPLLAERREALRALLTGAGIDWLDDPSNDDRAIPRNRIRHELLPALRASYNPALVDALTGLAARARETAAAVEREATGELARMARAGPSDVVLPLAELRALPGEIAAEVLRQAAARLGTRAPLRAWAHRGLRRLLLDPPARRPFALDGVTLEVSAGHVRVGRGPSPRIASRGIPVPGTVHLPEAGLLLETSVGPPGDEPIDAGPGRVAFDADLLPRPLLVRSRQAGDRMTPFGATAGRRLKRLLIEARLPRWERGRVPIVQAGSEVAWIGGVRRSALAPVTAATRRVVRLVLSPLPGGAARPVAVAGCIPADSS